MQTQEQPDTNAVALAETFGDATVTPDAVPQVTDVSQARPQAGELSLPPIPTAPVARPKRAARAAAEPVLKLADTIAPTRPAPALRSFGADIANKLPGADRLEIYKVLESGDEVIVPGNYPMATLGREPTSASMLARYVVPTFGGGKYHLFGIDARGGRHDAGYVGVAEPINTGSTAQQDPAAKYLHEHLQAREREVEQERVTVRALQQRELDRLGQPQPRAVDQIREFKESAQLLGLEGKDANQYVQGLVQAAQAQRPAVDPMMAMMLERMSGELSALREKMSQQASAASMPMPLPPPAVDPMASITPLLVAMQQSADRNMQLVLQIMSQPKETFGLKDAITLMAEMRPAKEEGFTPTKALEFVRDITQITKPEAPATSDFKGRIQELLMVVKLGRLMGGGEGGASFSDVMMTLINAQPGSVGAAIMRKIADDKPKQLAAAKKRTEAPRQAVDAQQQTKQDAPAEVVDAPPVDARPAAKKEDKPPRPLPDGTREACALIEQADGDAKIGEFINFLTFLGKGEWQPFVQALLQKVVADEKGPSIKLANRLLGLLVRQEMLSLDAAKVTIVAVERHWGKIVEGIRAQFESAAQQQANGDGPGEEDSEADDEGEATGPAPEVLPSEPEAPQRDEDDLGIAL
jgi:hypothetical protein